MKIDQSPQQTFHCHCPCHVAQIKVVCCACHVLKKEPCDCVEKKRCCGEPEPTAHPDWPPPPGWRPGDKPADNPLAGATDADDLQRRFGIAVIDILREGSSTRGPRFGPRKNEYLPYLVVRANAGDRGARPLPDGTTYWESPDIFIAPDLAASAAPVLPTTTGALAKAGVPNTLWAHVWNLGQAPVYNARVEFYWFNPGLSFDDSAAHLIGVAYVDLGSRQSGRAHTIVKCPKTWVPTFVNNGHECLIVRCFDPLTDPLGSTRWFAAADRHVAQRNLTVINASSPAALQLPLRLGCGAPPGPATVEVAPVKVDNVRWLSLLAGNRGTHFRDAANFQEVVGLMHPTPLQPEVARLRLSHLSRNSLGRLLQRRIEFERGCDELEVVFYVDVEGLQAGECRIYRIQQIIAGKVVGGYTVIARKQ
jgi:hypothetical protein